MGCNLCTLQKREEHYKLLYEIAQVNRRNLSKAEQDETAAAEAVGLEPVVVQVIRPAAQYQGHVADVCTQTDITFEHIMALAKLRPATPPVPDVCPFLLSDSCHSIHAMEREFYECPEYLSNMAAEVERTEEYVYEEVELCKQKTQEKLGLTLCYRTDEDDDMAIYVSQVEPNSLAARDGRIKNGDRILQINGHAVQDREVAVSVLSGENAKSVVLLVTRPETQPDDHAWLDDEPRDPAKELKMEILQAGAKNRNLKQDEAGDEKTPEAAPCSSNGQDKDSGFGCGTDSPEHVSAGLYRRSPVRFLREQRRAQSPHGGRGGVQSREGGVSVRNDANGILGLENYFQQLLEVKCQIRKGAECGVYSIRHSIECSLTEQGGGDSDDGAEEAGRGDGVERELRMLKEELRSIELECQNIVRARRPRQTGALPDIHEQIPSEKKQEKDASSAYNTAESARSSPPGREPSPERSLHRRVSIANRRNLQMASSKPSSPNPDQSRGSPEARPRAVFSSSPDQSNPSRSESDPALPADDERCEKKGKTKDLRRKPPLASYQSSPYHGSLGSRQLQSYMQLLQQHSSLEYSQSQLSLLSVCRDPPTRNARSGEPRLEWKVKVRADGSRYAARRPARDRILRERALRIREERSGGMTTDDDAMSEMKMGRYWSKEERKQQLARAREQRKRREFMQKSRFECLKEGPAGGAEGHGELSILELSHKKMMKKRNKKILDNWMTIQELMSHGARVPEDSKVHNAFLSVTTV
ncbi:PDZ domain-containing RING finger protein 4 [Hippocampus zosterae]|uniref:PDZ domain-containing RING finger protein 4 n=1 Tax=Hippocampus zosterae TaxID=109293 RepID=UPI00223D5E7D|nr:PDZ domain-containing RING finger protein 4 [Hippocampus zosterae]